MIYSRKQPAFVVMVLMFGLVAGQAMATSAQPATQATPQIEEKFAKPKDAHPLPVYTIDPNHTRVLFYVNHLGFSHTPGQFNAVAGTIAFDPARPQQSEVNATIQSAQVSMGLQALDAKIQTAEFFNTAKYPTITFKSHSIEKTGSVNGVMIGDLTLLGVTKAVKLDVKFNRKGWNTYAKADAIGFSATGKIRRSDFGMKAYLPDVGDDVFIRLEVEATEQRQQAPTTGLRYETGIQTRTGR